MSMNSKYELYFIVNPELTSDKTDQVIENVEKLLNTVLNAEDINVDKEGLKNLAYPINKHWSGFYVNITYTLSDDNRLKVKEFEKKLNLLETIVRYLNLNVTEFLEQQSKEKLANLEITDHRELNKGRANKICISKYQGRRVIDYKDTDFLNQFTSPYAKIFSREKTGTSAKFQRKITKAIKRARHMGLMPFTTKHFS